MQNSERRIQNEEEVATARIWVIPFCILNSEFCIRPMRTAAILALAALLPACSSGPAPPQRGKLEGKVTVNGKPAAKGTIRFMALEPGGVNAIASISDGQYSLPAAEGPTKGKYRVEINIPSGKKMVTDNPDIPGKKLEEDIELLPPRLQPQLRAHFRLRPRPSPAPRLHPHRAIMSSLTGTQSGPGAPRMDRPFCFKIRAAAIFAVVSQCDARVVVCSAKIGFPRSEWRQRRTLRSSLPTHSNRGHREITVSLFQRKNARSVKAQCFALPFPLRFCRLCAFELNAGTSNRRLPIGL